MLYIENSYLKQFNGNIIKASENKIILNKTIFYAKSGGQPGDTGIFTISTLIIDEISMIPEEMWCIIAHSKNN